MSGFFDFDASLPNDLGGEKPLADDEYDACNDETFGGGLGDDAWDETANAELIEKIEKERGVRDDEADLDHFSDAAQNGSGAQEKQGNEEDYFEANYITDSIQQMMLDDDDDEDFGALVPLDDPAIVCVPKSGQLPVKSAPRGISPPPNLPDLDEYGSPYKTSIWAPPSQGGSGKQGRLKDERPRVPPGLEGAQLPAKPPSVQQLPPRALPPQPQMASRSPFEDPSVVSALPMSSIGRADALPGRAQGPVKVVAQPKTLAELEQEMLASDHGAKQPEISPPRVPRLQGPPPPGMGPIFNAPPPMYMRMQAPRPHVAPIRGPLANGPIPAQVIRGGPVQPMPVDPRLGPPPHPQPLAGPMPRMNQVPPPLHPHQVQTQPQPPLMSHPRPQRDEYAGLMTDKDKTWLINIQLTQLNTNNPYIDDYYYTMYEFQRAKKAAGVKPLAVEGTYVPESLTSQAFTEHVLLTGLRDTLSAHHTAAFVYAPPGMENSLGKIAVASALCPRKIVDVHTVTSGSQQSVLVLIENVFTHLLELEDLRRQIAVVRNDEMKDAALKRLGCYSAIVNAMKPLHERAVLGSILSISKGRRLVQRLMTFGPIAVILGPIVTRAALCNLSSTFPVSSKGDREAFIGTLLGASCAGVFRVEDVINLLQGLLQEPSSLSGILASSCGVSLLLGVVHRAAILMEAIKSSNADAARKAHEQMFETTRSILGVLLATSVSPLVLLPGAGTRIAAALSLPLGAAEHLETRFGKSRETSVGQMGPGPGLPTAGSVKSAPSPTLGNKPHPSHRAHGSTAAALIAAAAASSVNRTSSLVPNTPPLIDFGTPSQTPPLADDRTPILVPMKSVSPGLGGR